MYASLLGKVTLIKPSYIVLENQGVGYLVVTPNPYMYHVDQTVYLYIHHYVREDTNTLYGFMSLESKELFIKLIGVSGIGPKSALSILATDNINDVIMAIENGEIKVLTKFPGIGMKSAQQIILDLKGKLVESLDDTLVPTQQSDAQDALLALGYSKTEVAKILKKINLDQPVELIVKEALKLLLK